MRLKDKIILITGAGSGIGKSTSILFAKEGAHVIINDLSSKAGNETLNEISNLGGKAMFIQADATNANEVEVMVSEIIREKGRIDVLFNNVGISGVGAVHDTSEELWDKVVNVNMKGIFLPCKSVLPHMMKQQNGTIINMSSCIAEIGLSRRAVYSATKGAILSLTKSMQVDYAPYNIKVNAILPGTILTPFVEDYLKNSYENYEDGLNSLKNRQLSGNLGRPDDVAKAALFMASDESDFMMGSPLYIDGGVTFGKMA